MPTRFSWLLVACACLVPVRAEAQEKDAAQPPASTASNKTRPARARQYLKESADWFRSNAGERVASNILSFQTSAGLWPKNIDVVSQSYDGDRVRLEGTFDNGATFDELRFLAHAFAATENPKFKEAVLKGLDATLAAQYPNGGWPQKVPPGKGYARFITFNDDTMVGIMRWLREVDTTDLYRFAGNTRRAAARTAFERGIQCILDAQVRIDGKPTVWCAQHDEKDLRPQHARSYELPSFSGSESVGIVRLLMSLDNPDARVREAVEGAVAWLEKSKLSGIRIERRPDANAARGFNKVVVPDASAPPVWARFYDLKTNRPFFCDRDGIPKPNLADIGDERRNGYSWYGDSPRALLEVDYPAWKRRVGK